MEKEEITVIQLTIRVNGGVKAEALLNVIIAAAEGVHAEVVGGIEPPKRKGVRHGKAPKTKRAKT